jgi:hypothetical protein
MFKDYEKGKAALDGLSKESVMIKVDNSIALPNSRPSGGNSNSNRNGMMGGGGSGGSDRFGGMNDDSNYNDTNPFQPQKMILKPVLQEHDIDQLLIEERDRDIKKINQDLAIVQDMFMYVLSPLIFNVFFLFLTFI